jgi:hypothetical protein
MFIEGKSLTSASAIVQWRCKGIFDDFRTVKSYQADAMFDFGSTTIAEALMSIDRYLHGGYVNNVTEFNVHITPDSPTFDDFERCRAYFVKSQEVTRFEFRIEVPALKKNYSFNAIMTGHPNIQAAKLLGSGAFTFATDLDGSSDTN